MRIAVLTIAAGAILHAQEFKDVRPILASNCLGCHAGKSRMGGLDLETFEGMRKGGGHGEAFVPGKSGESRMYLMLVGKAAPVMPLSGKPLSAGEIEIIRKWIDAGANPPKPGEEATARASLPDIKPRVPVKAQIGAVAWRPDGNLLALGRYKEVVLADASGKTAAALTGHAEAVRALAFSPDGRWLAAAGGLPGRAGEVKIWDVEKRAQTLTIDGHSDCIYAVAFAPDGKTIATASYDKLIKFWNAATGKEIRTLKDHIDAVYALAFVPDGKRLVSAAADRTVKVWDTGTGERLFTMSEALDGLNTLALDPTGTKVAAAGLDKSIRIWSLGEKSGTMVQSLIAHEDAILKLAWSPDGKYLVSTAADRTLKIFKADDLTEVKAFAKQPDWVLSLAYSPDGKSFAAGRYDGSLAILN